MKKREERNLRKYSISLGRNHFLCIEGKCFWWITPTVYLQLSWVQTLVSDALIKALYICGSGVWRLISLSGLLWRLICGKYVTNTKQKQEDRSQKPQLLSFCISVCKRWETSHRASLIPNFPGNLKCLLYSDKFVEENWIPESWLGSLPERPDETNTSAQTHQHAVCLTSLLCRYMSVHPQSRDSEERNPDTDTQHEIQVFNVQWRVLEEKVGLCSPCLITIILLMSEILLWASETNKI